MVRAQACTISFSQKSLVMDDLKEKTADLVDHVEDLADTFYKLSVVTITQKITNAASGAVALMAVTILGFFIIGFLGVALSWWLGELVGSRALGFVLGSVFFILLLLVIVGLRKRIVFPFIRNSIIRKIYE